MDLTEMDSSVSLREQMMTERSPVTLIAIIRASAVDADALIAAWADDARYFKQQPGFISTQLHRGIAGSGVFLNYAIWESVEQFRKAFANPEFHAKLAAYPVGTTGSPHLFEKLAVPGICVA